MKFLKGKFSKKLVAMVIVGATVIGLTHHIGVINSKAQEVTNQEEISEIDGLEKSIQIDEQKVVKCETKDISSEVTEVTSYKEDGSKTVNEVTSEGIKTFYYDEAGDMVYEENMDFSDYEEKQRTTRYVPLVKVYENFNRKHWYQKVEGILYIGCEKEYQILYDSLSDSKQGCCKAYMNAIDASNVAIAAAIASIALLVIASKGTLTGICAMVLKMAGEGATKKQIAETLVKKFVKYIAKKKAETVVKAILNAVSITGFMNTRSDVKYYYKIIREYDISYNW